jgi:hypothetical protein
MPRLPRSPLARASALVATLVAALVVAACGDVLSASLGRLPTGTWGGDHIGVFVDSAGATFLFDCAGGRVEGPIALNAAGDFDVVGTFAGAGNTVNADHSPHPARYAGHATGTRLDVTRTLLDGSGAPASFTATLGDSPHVIAC